MSRSTKTFSAQMNYVKFNSPYRFMIRAYNYTTAEKARGLELYPVNGQVLVISIQGNSREDYVHMPLTKESNEAASITCKSRK
jgi:calcineurin-like phosphoesterase